MLLPELQLLRLTVTLTLKRAPKTKRMHTVRSAEVVGARMAHTRSRACADEDVINQADRRAVTVTTHRAVSPSPI